MKRARRTRARAKVGMSPTLKKSPFFGPLFYLFANLEFLRPRWAATEDKLLGNCRNFNLHSERRDQSSEFLHVRKPDWDICCSRARMSDAQHAL